MTCAKTHRCSIFFYGGKACCWKARCSRSARYAAGLRRKRERRTLAWWRCFKRARVSRHLTGSTAAKSWALIGARRVSVAARTRTEPRTTRLGEIGAEGPNLLAAGGAPLMVALGAEELLQVVVGRRQAGNLQVVEQAGSVAVGDLEEAVDGVAQ